MSEIKIETIKSFTDLDVWQEGHKLVLMVFQAAATFPKEEMNALTYVLKKSVLGITANVAEAFGRTAFKEKVQFYTFSLKAVREVQNYILVAKDLDYMNEETFQKIAEQTAIVSKLCKVRK